METHLRGRIALVTAASKGLGFACARALASEGCRVAMSSSRSETLDAAVGQLAAEGFDGISLNDFGPGPMQTIPTASIFPLLA